LKLSGPGSYLDAQPTLALPAQYQIKQLAFIAEMLGMMLRCIISRYTKTVFPWKQARTLLIDSYSISISRHVHATPGRISLGLTGNSEAGHKSRCDGVWFRIGVHAVMPDAHISPDATARNASTSRMLVNAYTMPEQTRALPRAPASPPPQVKSPPVKPQSVKEAPDPFTWNAPDQSLSPPAPHDPLPVQVHQSLEVGFDATREEIERLGKEIYHFPVVLVGRTQTKTSTRQKSIQLVGRSRHASRNETNPTPTPYDPNYEPGSPKGSRLPSCGKRNPTT
jgi:hypothetical protein